MPGCPDHRGALPVGEEGEGDLPPGFPDTNLEAMMVVSEGVWKCLDLSRWSFVVGLLS